MALLQALLAFLSRSAGKILNAVFGWAIVALFGQPTPTEKVYLTAVVGAAAIWPLLVVGAIAPKVMTTVLTFIKVPESVPSWTVRVVWIVLAIAVPLVVGIVTAK